MSIAKIFILKFSCIKIFLLITFGLHYQSFVQKGRHTLANFILKYRLNKFLLQIYQTYVIITSEFYINPMLTIVKGDNLYEQ